jgi:hypothetical protein
MSPDTAMGDELMRADSERSEENQADENQGGDEIASLMG